jgi:ribosome-binding protein aMBF1 (putative translation factor)
MTTTNDADPIELPSVTRVAEANVENATTILKELNRSWTESGISIEELADRVGITVESAELIRQYDYDPTMSEIRRLANALGVTIEYEVARG